MDEKIYLDHNASTPLASEVQEAMRPYLAEAYGNPSSSHWAGQPARRAVARARAQVADFLGAQPGEIVFTSGGSESNNTAIKGAWFGRSSARDRLVTSAVEHPATLEPCRFLTRLGARLDILPTDGTGQVDPGELASRLNDDLLLLTIMHANNEVGTLQPIRVLADQAHSVGALVHSDAAQSAGKVALNVRKLGVDLLSLAGHKLYAPKGIGALFVREGTPLEPLIHGAGHESGRRSGTESAMLAVGLGAACELATRNLAHMSKVQDLRDRLWQGLQTALGKQVVLQGHPTARLPNTLNVAFKGCRGDQLLDACTGLAASTGAACHGGGATLSDTLQAMAVVPEVGAGTIRLSLGVHTTVAEVDAAVTQLVAARTDLLKGP